MAILKKHYHVIFFSSLFCSIQVFAAEKVEENPREIKLPPPIKIIRAPRDFSTPIPIENDDDQDGPPEHIKFPVIQNKLPKKVSSYGAKKEFSNIFELIAYIMCPPAPRSPVKKRSV